MTPAEELLDEKRFYDRFYALHHDPLLVRVYERFGIGVFRRSSVLEGFNDFARKNGFSGKRVVEIGTCHGLTAAVLSRWFGEVVTIDIEPNAKKRQIAEFLKIENVRFVDVKDNAEKATVIADLDFDAAFVDGDHARDTDSDVALVRRCGRVLLHENWAPQPAVVAAVNRLAIEGHVVTAGKWALWSAA